MKNEFQIKGSYTGLLFVFKWYWLYKKKKKKCNKENVEHLLWSFISRNSPNKKISQLPFFFLMVMSFGECD